jgi:hypothetical protein
MLERMIRAARLNAHTLVYFRQVVTVYPFTALPFVSRR